MRNPFDDLEPFHIGELIYVTGGVYSAYGIHFIGRVMKDFAPKDFQTSHKGLYGAEWNLDYQRLTTEGYVEELIARELWTGEG